MHTTSQQSLRQRTATKSTSSGGLGIPVLVVGNKLDEAYRGSNKNRKQLNVLQDLGITAGTIETSAKLGNVDCLAFESFFSSVISSSRAHASPNKTLGEHTNPAMQIDAATGVSTTQSYASLQLPRPSGRTAVLSPGAPSAHEKWK